MVHYDVQVHYNCHIICLQSTQYTTVSLSNTSQPPPDRLKRKSSEINTKALSASKLGDCLCSRGIELWLYTVAVTSSRGEVAVFHGYRMVMAVRRELGPLSVISVCCLPPFPYTYFFVVWKALLSYNGVLRSL